MSGGAQPKRVTCPLCGSPEGMSCRDPESFKNCSPHRERQSASDKWYVTKSPDGLTPQRRDAMVEELGFVLDRRQVGKAMEKITRAADPEKEFAKQRG